MRDRRLRRTITAPVFLALLIALTTLPAVAGAAADGLSPRKFSAMLDSRRGDSDLQLLDIRTPGEFRQGHIPGAVLIDYYARDFVDRINALDRKKTYLVYCRSGNRSGRSLALFKRLGFAHVYHLETGLIGWSRENLPLVRPNGS